jgi:hypothetical protein
MDRLASRRWVAGFAAIAAGIALAVAVNPSIAVGAGAPPACSPGGPVEQKSPPVDCPKITVNPSTNLIDLQFTTVKGHDFVQSGQAATLECASGATSQDQCDLNTLYIVSTSPIGTFSLRRYVRRVISLSAGGTIDCASGPGACIMASANLNNYLEATSVPLSFNPTVPPITPTVFALPATALADHQVVKVSGAGMLPNSSLTIMQCEAGLPPSYSTCDFSTQSYLPTTAKGSFATKWPVHRMLLIQGNTIDCASRKGACEVFAGEYPGASGSAVAPLGFNPRIPPASQAITLSATTGLQDHQLVTVRGTGYTPGAPVIVIQCQTGATSGLNCDEVSVATGSPGLGGQFTITYPVHRILSLGGTTFDCALKARSCFITAVNEQRQTEAASAKVSFNPKVPPVVAAIKVVPGTGLLDNSAVSVTGTGFTPFSNVNVNQCGAEVTTGNFGYCSFGGPYGGGGVSTQVGADGNFKATFFVHRVIDGQTGLINCGKKPGACVIAATRFGSAGDTAFKPISFK